MVRVKTNPRNSRPSAAPSSIGGYKGSSSLSDVKADRLFSTDGNESDCIIIGWSDDEKVEGQQQNQLNTQEQEESSESSDEEDALPSQSRRKRIFPVQKAYERTNSHTLVNSKTVESPARKGQYTLSSSDDSEDENSQPQEKMRPLDATRNDRSVAVACGPHRIRQHRRKGGQPIKKTSHLIPRGTHVQSEIRRLQASKRLQIPRVAFARVCREISQNIVNSYSLLEAPPNWQSLALTVLQVAAEEYITTLFEDCQCAALHANRATIFPRDIALVARLRGPSDAGFRFRVAPDAP